jgi:periplasmic protein TonB
MQAAHFEDPMRQPYRIHHSRIWRVTGAVMLGHIGVAWLVSIGVLTSVVPASEPDNVIMASVVMDAPAPAAPKPEPARPQIQAKTKPQPERKPQAKPVSPPVQPTPVLSPTAPSDAAPIVSSTTPAPATATATAPAPASPSRTTEPQAAGHQRTATHAPAAAVVLPSTSADYLNNPAPPYPRVSKRMGEQGTVLIRVFINTEGRAEKAEVRTSSGYARLDDTALNTVQAWRFVPGQSNGVPEAMWFNVPIRFVLD